VRELDGLADIVRVGGTRVDIPAVLAVLRERGLGQVLCEGGPTLFGALIEADALDELYLTVAPTLESGEGRRIATGPARPRSMRLGRILRSGNTLLLRYDR